MDSKKDHTILFLFTAEFPFSLGETFIENEMPYLSEGFSKVVVFPFKKEGGMRELQNNIQVRILSSAADLSFRDYLLLFKILCYEFLKMNRKLFFLKNSATWISQLKKGIVLSKSLEKEILARDNDATVYYSYWMNEWALALSVLKHRNKIKSFVFRCGGYDIWDERYDGNYLPFRFYMYKMSSGIYPNSMVGERYIKAYQHFAYKVRCLYWGTNDQGLNPFDSNKIACIVSCSSLIPLKRINKIIGILKEVSFPIKWVHFGDGPLKEDLIDQMKVLPSHVIVEMKGNVRNNEVMDYYKNNSVTCFINASSTESLPVSIQEAISFGIPVIAPNVGGVSEIVNEETGLLLEADFVESEVAYLLKDLIRNKFSQADYRKNVRIFWSKKFSANENYPAFVKLLK